MSDENKEEKSRTEEKDKASDSDDSRKSEGSDDAKKQDNKRSGDDKKQEDNSSGDDKKKKPRRPSKKAFIIGGIVLLVLIVCGVLYYLHARHFESTDDAYTTGHIHQISARITGTVVSVQVDDNEVVVKGQPLALLDPSNYRIALEKAEAQMTQAHAQVTQARAQVAQRDAAAGRAGANLQKAQSDYDRVTSLYQKDIKAVSKADVDTATAALRSAQSEAAAAKADTAAAQAQLEVAHSGVKTAQAALDDAKLQLSYTRIIAPVGGKIGKKNIESGQRIQPGQALMAVVQPDVWVLANLKETQLSDVRLGQKVTIEIDAIPDHEFVGHIDSFQPGSGATFALLPPDNATGNFTKIVQRVPVKIVFEPKSLRGYESRVYPGLSVQPKIDLRTR